jgi:hypothetical protein
MSANEVCPYFLIPSFTFLLLLTISQFPDDSKSSAIHTIKDGTLRSSHRKHHTCSQGVG